MKKVELELYAHTSTIAVVHLPERRFPGIVLQGDTLSILHSLAMSIMKRTSNLDDTELQDEAQELLELLEIRLKFYEITLQQHGIELPYHPIKRD